MDISALGPHSEKLFQLCSNSQWSRLNKRLLLVSADGEVSAHQELNGQDFQAPAIVFPVDAAVRELELRLNEQDNPAQMELVLPPVAVRKAMRGER